MLNFIPILASIVHFHFHKGEHSNMTKVITAANSSQLSNLLTTVFGKPIELISKNFSLVEREETINPPLVEHNSKTVEVIYGPTKTSDTLHNLTITGLGTPTIGTKLNHCAIERVLNRVKDDYIEGNKTDISEELLTFCKGRQFHFCMAYTFKYNDDKLIINFHVSHTQEAPAWVDEKSGLLTPMSSDAINHFASAFVHQCERALRNYVNSVYNKAAQKQVRPNYYGTP